MEKQTKAQQKTKKPYECPQIIYETRVETRAGSCASIVNCIPSNT